jgi:hypothetical protein
MGICYEIAQMKRRLEKHQIPMDHLVYELNDLEWLEFESDVNSHRYTQCDLTYVDDVIYMGMRVRKRKASALRK